MESTQQVFLTSYTHVHKIAIPETNQWATGLRYFYTLCLGKCKSKNKFTKNETSYTIIIGDLQRLKSHAFMNLSKKRKEKENRPAYSQTSLSCAFTELASAYSDK